MITVGTGVQSPLVVTVVLFDAVIVGVGADLVGVGVAEGDGVSVGVGVGMILMVTSVDFTGWFVGSKWNTWIRVRNKKNIEHSHYIPLYVVIVKFMHTTCY
jgi:uncharacterized protein YjlB